MKKSNIIMAGSAALVALAAVTGVALSTYAQTNTVSSSSNSSTTQNSFKNGRYANLTDEQKAAMEARRQEMEAVQTTIKTAMSQGYDAWVAAVKKAYGDTAQILDGVTADNFAKYVEASGYMEQAKTYSQKARTILDEIGVQGGLGSGMGKHEGKGRGMGMPGL
jgi:hypothetical protein